MIENKKTPNQKAKEYIWHILNDCILAERFDYEVDDMTDKEKKELERHYSKHVDAIYKRFKL